MEIALKDLVLLLSGQLEGDGEVKINNISKIEEGTAGTVSFLSNVKYEQYVYTTQASAVIVSEDFKAKEAVNTNLIRVKDPYTSITILLEQYQQMMAMQKVGREAPIYVAESAEVGEGEYLAAFSYVGKNVKIGKNVKLYPHAYVGDNCVIGDNTVLYAGTKVYDNSVIGNNCVLHANCVVGSDGFGFAPQEDGTYKTIPQVGNVIIKDNVSIGAAATVDCATMGSTVIGNGVKLDNMVQVAHNVEIGDNTVIAAQAGIAGSTKIGKQCMIGGQAGFAGHQKIGDGAKVGAKAGVPKDLKPGETVLGAPAFHVIDFMKASAVFKNLPEMSRRVRELEEKVLNLPTI